MKTRYRKDLKMLAGTVLFVESEKIELLIA
jgi:hypothetical protein